MSKIEDIKARYLRWIKKEDEIAKGQTAAGDWAMAAYHRGRRDGYKAAYEDLVELTND